MANAADLQAQAQEVYALEQIYGKENIKSHHDGYNLNVEVRISGLDKDSTFHASHDTQFHVG